MRAPNLVARGVSCALLAVALPSTALAAPAPCGSAPQITDPTGDGHHANTDVTAAWFSEAGGLQAVIRTTLGSFAPAHDDSDVAGFALTYEVDGVRRYVRAEAPRTGAMRFDAGVWTPSGGFASAGPISGTVTSGAPGYVVMNVPPLARGTRIGRPLVLTYDGDDLPGVPHWVDRAPGGTSTVGSEFGADLIVGACSGSVDAPLAGPAGSTGAGPSGLPGTGTGTGTAPASVAGVTLTAPRVLVGGGRVSLRGTLRPLFAAFPVTVSVRGITTRRIPTQTDGTGSFSVGTTLSETSRIDAQAGGLNSQTLTVTVRATVRVQLRRTASGGYVIRGRTRPALPGQVLWLRDGAAIPSARTRARGGRFVFRRAHPPSGRYQAVFIPSGGRAERAVSNQGVIK